MPVHDGTIADIDSPSISNLRVSDTLTLGSVAEATLITARGGGGLLQIRTTPGNIIDWPYVSLEPEYRNTNPGGGSGIAFNCYAEVDPNHNVGAYELFVETDSGHNPRGLQVYSTEHAGTMFSMHADAGGPGKPGFKFGTLPLTYPLSPTVSLFQGFSYALQTNGGFFVSEDSVHGVYMDAFSGQTPQISMDGYIEMEELVAAGFPNPGVASANNGRIYMRDNGSGKTQVVVQFATGSPVVMATEP